jgi:hypothetical protein
VAAPASSRGAPAPGLARTAALPGLTAVLPRGAPLGDHPGVMGPHPPWLFEGCADAGAHPWEAEPWPAPPQRPSRRASCTRPLRAGLASGAGGGQVSAGRSPGRPERTVPPRDPAGPRQARPPRRPEPRASTPVTGAKAGRATPILPPRRPRPSQAGQGGAPRSPPPRRAPAPSVPSTPAPSARTLARGRPQGRARTPPCPRPPFAQGCPGRRDTDDAGRAADLGLDALRRGPAALCDAGPHLHLRPPTSPPSPPGPSWRRADPQRAGAQAQSLWGTRQTLAGLLIALSAPFLGAYADASGRKTAWIAGFSVVVILCAWSLWFLSPTAPTSCPCWRSSGWASSRRNRPPTSTTPSSPRWPRRPHRPHLGHGRRAGLLGAGVAVAA